MRVWADLIVALGIVVAVGTYLSIDQQYTGFFVVVAFVLASLVYLAGTVVAMIVSLVHARWGRAATSAAKFIAFVALFMSCVRAGDYVHLALFYPIYHQQIEEQGSGNIMPVRFNWGDKALWVTDGLQNDVLVYDPTDVLAASIGKVRDGETGFSLATRHLVGHFYVEREFFHQRAAPVTRGD